MKTPKIRFDYSTQYNNLWRDWFKSYMKNNWKRFLEERKRKKKASHSERYRIKKTLEYIKKIEKIWRKDEKRILKELSRTTGLKWKEDSVICYIIWAGNSIAVPLTVIVHNDTNDFIDTLIHELIHYLLVDGDKNSKLSVNAQNYFSNKYKNEKRNVIHHILLFAIMQHTYLKFFDMERFEKHIDISKSSPDYARAWQIVQKEGCQKIIREFRKCTKTEFLAAPKTKGFRARIK